MLRPQVRPSLSGDTRAKSVAPVAANPAHETSVRTRFCLGIDVAKAKLDGVLCTLGTQPTSRHYRQVPNTREGAEQLCRWAQELAGCAPQELRVLMEATSAYHLQAAETAWREGCEVVIVNPRRARQYAKALGRLTKNDRVDAEVLARFGLNVRAHRWTPPPPALQELWELLARRATLEDMARREESRTELVELRNSPPTVRASLEESIRFCAYGSERLTHEIDALFAREPPLNHDRQLLLSIPGVGTDAAAMLLCLLRGNDFESPRQAAAFCGVTPVHRHSGTRTTSGGHVARERNRVFRAALRMPALSARRTDPQLRALYEQLRARGKHSRQAFIAVVHRLVRVAFGVLKHQRPYDPLWRARTDEERRAAPREVPLKRLRRKNARRLARLPEVSGSTESTLRPRPRIRVTQRPRRWTQEELELLRAKAGQLPLQNLAALLSRTPIAVQLKINAAGLSSLPARTAAAVPREPTVSARAGGPLAAS